MASVQSAFDGAVSSQAYSYFLGAIPAQLHNDPFNRIDLTGTPGGEKFAGTSQSDYVVLGLGDKLLKTGVVPGGLDVVQTGSAINIDGTGFRGVVLTGDKNIGATGSDGNDAIAGNTGNNHIKAGGGNDVAAGGDGDDRIDGDSGNDTLFGDAGNDVLFGRDGEDQLHGGAGEDKLSGGDGNDTLYGDAGNDTLWGDSGNDSLEGGLGDDTLFGDAGNDSLLGMVGDDELFGGAGADTLFGGLGSDFMEGGAGADRFVMQDRAAGDIDTIADFNPVEDIIDLSATGVTSVDDLTKTDDGHGNTIITLPDTTQFKLIGYSPDDIQQNFFTF